MTPDIKNILIVALVVLFIGFRLYRRVRRNIGRQPLQRGWLIVRVISLLLVACILFATSPVSSQTIFYALGGAMIGAGIGVYALRHTRIEQTEKGYFYTGHPYIGLGILGLFVARLLFNLARAYSRFQEIAAQAQSHGPAARQAMLTQSVSSPLTLGVFILMAAYYVVYSLGLLRMAK